MDESRKTYLQKLRVRTLDEYLEAFRQVLGKGWKHVCFVDADPEHHYIGLPAAVGDWQQIQWEFMVESMLKWTGQLDGYLSYYGEGMDETISMRHAEQDAVATHEVCLVPLEGNCLVDCILGRKFEFPERGFPFGEFVSFEESEKDSWYGRKPPYTHVLSHDIPEESDGEIPAVFPREQVRFVLSPILTER